MPGSKAAYHAAAVLAAGGLVALLDAIVELGRVAGLDEAGAMAIYGPLIDGTLANARALGVDAALTGPITRGDTGTLARPPRRAARPRPGRAGPVSRRRGTGDRHRLAPWHAGTGACGRPSIHPCKPGLTGYH